MKKNIPGHKPKENQENDLSDQYNIGWNHFLEDKLSK